jgi:hypothetical protein
MGEARQEVLRVGFDRVIKLEFHGARVSSDAGLFPFRDLDEAAQLTESGAAELFGFRACSNIANPGTNRLSGHSECRFCLYFPLVVVHFALEFPGGIAVYLYVSRRAPLLDKGRMGNVG